MGNFNFFLLPLLSFRLPLSLVSLFVDSESTTTIRRLMYFSTIDTRDDRKLWGPFTILKSHLTYPTFHSPSELPSSFLRRIFWFGMPGLKSRIFFRLYLINCNFDLWNIEFPSTTVPITIHTICDWYILTSNVSER